MSPSKMPHSQIPNKMKKNLIFCVCIASLLSACSIQRKVVVRFSPVENKITVSPVLINLLEIYPNPSIVLRVPGLASGATESQLSANNLIYNSIEKSLLRNGFVVRDRALFNEVFTKMLDSDYSKINETTTTDLILELVLIDLCA